MTDLVTLGEALMDLPSTQAGVGLRDAPAFTPVPAGAPANVAVAAVRLGLTAAFVSKVGADPFGEAVVRAFARKGVDTTHVLQDPNGRTGLAFVSVPANNGEGGEREFLFYFDVARDLALRPDELPLALLAEARAFHFGSISLSAEPCRAATLTAARHARAGGALVSYDPNLRPRLWPDENAMRREGRAGFANADIAKVAEEELTFLVPEEGNEAERAARLFAECPPLRLLAVTRGANGCTGYARGGEVVHAPGFTVPFVDATGAGDAFAAGLIASQLHSPPLSLQDALAYANACGALATTTLGATASALSDGAARALISKGRTP